MKLCSIAKADVHLTLYAVLSLTAALLWFPPVTVIVSISALALHEAVHMVTAKRLGYRVSEIHIHPFGAIMKLERFAAMPNSEWAVALSAPIANIVSACVCTTLLRLSGELRFVLEPLLQAHLAIGIWNLLPFMPADGGRVLHSVLCRFHTPVFARTITYAITFLCEGILTLTAFYAAYRHNISWAMPAVMLGWIAESVLSWRQDKHSGVETLLYHRMTLSGGQPMDVRFVVLCGAETLQAALGTLRTDVYTIIRVVDQNHKMIGEAEENQILDALGKFGTRATLWDVLQNRG